MEVLDFSPLLKNRKCVQQPLGGMFVRTVAGVDDAGTKPIRKKARSARRAVPQHNDVRTQRLKIESGILESLAF